ncbi:MAG: right-handed parallel beta-helix repeat-containing protein [Candidatus Hodarchaeales archaeon]|jgi:parallel beta-helix repeat protein
MKLRTSNIKIVTLIGLFLIFPITINPSLNHSIEKPQIKYEMNKTDDSNSVSKNNKQLIRQENTVPPLGKAEGEIDNLLSIDQKKLEIGLKENNEKSGFNLNPMALLNDQQFQFETSDQIPLERNSAKYENNTYFNIHQLDSVIEREPINISSNNDFITLGFPGNGSVVNPYRIENYNITNSSVSALIIIENTNAYFIIQNNFLHGINYFPNGVYLYNVTNGIIRSNIINMAYSGIFTNSSAYNRLENNTVIQNDRQGFRIESSNNNVLINNYVSQCGRNGFRLFNSSYNDLINNTAIDIVQYGFYLTSSSNNNSLNNNTASNNDHGFILASSSSNTLTKNIANNNNNNGFYLLPSSNNNTLTSNAAISNELVGFYLHESSSNTLINNIANNDFYSGFYFQGSSNHNTLRNNTANNSFVGFYLFPSSFNTLINNTANMNSDSGFVLEGSEFNTLTDNTATSNSNIGFVMSATDSNTLTNNIAISNGDTGFGFGATSSNNTLINNTAINSSDHGFYLINSENNTLINNFATSNGNGFYIYSNGNDNILINNTATNNQYGYLLISSSFITMNGNTATNNSLRGFRLNSCNNNTMTSNIANSSGWGFYLYFSNFNVLSNNTAFKNTYGFVIDGSYNVLTKNNAINNIEQGFHITNTLNNVEENMATGGNFGFFLYSSSFNTLRMNNAISNKEFGFYLESSSNNNLTDNNGRNNNLSGIYLFQSNNNNLLRNNIENHDRGIDIYLGYDNRISNNIISGNFYSFDIETDSNTTTNIYTFNILRNNTLIYLDGQPEIWNGNYYDDYTGIGNYLVFGLIEDTNPNPAVIINGNSDFSNMALNRGLKGNGTVNNPYVISEYWIPNANQRFGSPAITIFNIDLHFQITRVKITNTTGNGIYLANLTNGAIIDSLINGSSKNGILFQNVNETEIINTFVGYSIQHGFNIESSLNNTFRNNIGYANSLYGIVLKITSYNNSLFSNYFIDNLLGQATDYDLTHSNNWSNGILGNYYSDYNETDLNRDGIGEIAFQLSGNANNEDPHPIVILIKPGINYIKIIEGITPLGQQITWTTTHFSSMSCSLYQNNYLIHFGNCLKGESIVIDLDALSIGIYNFTLIVSYEFVDTFNLTLKDTIIVDNLDQTAPVISCDGEICPSELILIQGDNIPFIALLNDLHPANFTIYKNGTLIEHGIWLNGELFVRNYGNLELGIHNINIILQDTSGNTISHSIMITIILETPTTTDTETTSVSTSSSIPTNTSSSTLPESSDNIGIFVGAGLLVVVTISGLVYIRKVRKTS